MEYYNGKVVLVREARPDGKIIEKFNYHHAKAIENYDFEKYMACTVNVNVANSYLQSMLDLFETKFYRFTDEQIHRDDDVININETIGVIMDYTTMGNGNKYTRKIFIKDGDSVVISRAEDGSIFNIMIDNSNKIFKGE